MAKQRGIYRIVHTDSDRCYVGQSVDIQSRWKQHIRDLNAGRHHASYLQRVWTKYGPGAFVFEVLEECEVESLTQREQFWMDTFKSAFNSGPAIYSASGYRTSEESRQALYEERAERGRQLMGEINNNRTPEDRQEWARHLNSLLTPEQRLYASKIGAQVRSEQLKVDKEHQGAAGKVRAPITNCKRWRIDRGLDCHCGRHV